MPHDFKMQDENSVEINKSIDAFADLALPKKVIAATKNLSANVAREELPDELMRNLKKVVRDVGWDYGPHYSRVFAPLFKRAQETFKKGLLNEQYRHIQEILRSVVDRNPTFSSTVPIVLQSSDQGKVEQVGSGALIRIIDKTFLLSAAHVIDFYEKGTLLIPSQNGFMPISGKLTISRMPSSGSRRDDKWDIAFVSLGENCANRLHSDIMVLGRPDVCLEASPERYEYTFAGFPWRRSRTKEQFVETNLTTMSGIEAKKSEYDALQLDPKFHIAMRFHRRRAFSHKLRRPIKSVLPDGMSGGGVYIWSEEALKNWPVRLPLVGIVSEKALDKNILIATRLHVYIQWIFDEEPELAARASGRNFSTARTALTTRHF
jgi:hypothetical protein